MRVKLGDICTKGVSSLMQKDVLGKEGSYPVYGASDCIGAIDSFHQQHEYVAVVKDGAGIGRAMLLPAQSSVIGTMQYLLPKNGISAQYLFYVVQHLHLEKYFSGATIPHIYFKDYKNETFRWHPQDKQQEIISVLGNTQKVIQKRKQQLEKLDELVKARFVELFGDFRSNPNQWEVSTLGEACDVRDGTHDSPKYRDAGYPLITSKNVTSGQISFADCNYISEEDYRKISIRSRVDDGDILMPMIGTVGTPVIVRTKTEFAIKNVSLIKFPVSAKLTNTFVHQFLQSAYFESIISSKSRGGTQKFLSLGDIRGVKIFIPPAERQQNFSAFVEEVDKSKVVVQKSLEKAQQLYDSLMQQYFD